MAPESFAEACRFAKVVETPDGPALLIGGEVVGSQFAEYRPGVPYLSVAEKVSAMALVMRGPIADRVGSAIGSNQEPAADA